MAKTAYETAVSRRRVDTISTMDVQITQEVQLFLQSPIGGVGFYSRRRLMLMKSTLSYHHTLLLAKGEGTATLPQRMYWLMSPIVYVYTGGKAPSPELSPKEEAEFLVTMIEAWECMVRNKGGVSSLMEGEEWGGKGAALDRGDFSGTVPSWAKSLRQALLEADSELFDHVIKCARNIVVSDTDAVKIDSEEEVSLGWGGSC
jgi:hypothetical protein